MPYNLNSLHNCRLSYTAEMKFPTLKPFTMQFFIPIFAGLEQYFEAVTVATPFYLASLNQWSQMPTLLQPQWFPKVSFTSVQRSYGVKRAQCVAVKPIKNGKGLLLQEIPRVPCVCAHESFASPVTIQALEMPIKCNGRSSALSKKWLWFFGHFMK